MTEIHSDQDLDELVWSILQHSTHPRDFLDFIRHTYNRPSEQEQAFVHAETYWGQEDVPRLFPKAVEALEVLADQGNPFAIYNLGRWHRLGYGVERDSAKGLAWYRKGADLGCSRSLINLARHTGNEDVPVAIEIFKKAAEDYGDLAAHCYWADYDKANYIEHLRLGGKSSDLFARYCWAFHCVKVAETDSEKEAAVALVRQAAEKGEGLACVSMGQYYASGLHGCPVDQENHLYWSKRGANLGNERACVAYGMALLDSSEPRSEAWKYLKRSAMLGEAYGQSVLGLQMLNHGSSPQVQAEGVEWLRTASRQSYLPAMSKLANALQYGKGCEVNEQEALYWLETGTQQGDVDCQVSMGTAYMYGDLVHKNQEKGHNLYYLASLQGDAWATYLLGISYENGHGTQEDAKQAFDCFQSAAEKGIIAATYKVGLSYLYGQGVEKDIPAGAKWLHKAAKRGDADAQAYMGMLFVYGHGVQENKETATYWLKLAAEQDNRMGLRELALLYADERIDSEKRAEAVRLMAKAAAKGDERAQEWIKEHCPERPEWLKGIEHLALPNDSEEHPD